MLQSRILTAVEARGNALSALAKHYLPSLQDDHVAQLFVDARRELDVLQLRQRAKVGELREALTAAASKRDEVEDRLEVTTKRLEELVAERTRLESLVAERLAADAEFRRLTADVGHATAALERDEARAEELQSESRAKLPAYRASHLFRYLLDVGFGTPNYTKKGFVRSMDRMVAKLVDWPRTKAGYDFLSTIPKLVAVEVERRREEFESTMAKLDAMEERVEREVGLSKVREDGESLGRQREKMLADLEAAQAEEVRCRAELEESESATGRFHVEALARLRDHFDRAGLRQLATRALETADPVDDRLVAAIEAAEREIDALRASASSVGTAREQTVERAKALSELVLDLRRRECDSVRCSFERMTPSAFERRVEAIAEGRDEVGSLKQDLRRAETFRRGMEDVKQHAESMSRSGGELGTLGGILLHAAAAVADAALSKASAGGAASRGVRRHFGGGSRSGSGNSRRGGGFTRGSGF